MATKKAHNHVLLLIVKRKSILLFCFYYYYFVILLWIAGQPALQFIIVICRLAGWQVARRVCGWLGCFFFLFCALFLTLLVWRDGRVILKNEWITAHWQDLNTILYTMKYEHTNMNKQLQFLRRHVNVLCLLFVQILVTILIFVRVEIWGMRYKLWGGVWDNFYGIRLMLCDGQC